MMDYERYIEANKASISKKYKEVAVEMLRRNFPLLTTTELEGAVSLAVTQGFKDSPASIRNNYTKQNMDTSLNTVTNYILEKKPIITSYGLMFKHHGTVPNPIFDLVHGFIINRKKIKKKMFEYPKGSEMFAKYNLSQLLEKLNANGFYGAIGMFSCIFYNLEIAATVTRCGRSANSAASLFFESFLDNNVPFGSCNEMIGFIYNVLKEKRTLNDKDILKKQVTIDEVFVKLFYTAGFGWVPSTEEMEMIWEILCTCTDEDLNRLYYKNNLFVFIKDSVLSDTIVYCLQLLKEPFMDPNNPPEHIKDTLDSIYELLYEYVYYKEQIIDRLDKMNSIVRNVSIIQDTDSSIVSLDGLYRFTLGYCRGIPMDIKTKDVDIKDYLIDGTGTTNTTDTITDYDFENDEIIERDRLIDPMVFIPQDGLRYSIVNIFSYCITLLVNDYMYRYTNNSNSSDETHSCFLVLKNEFLFKRVLVQMEAKKHYAYIGELQEGNAIPDEMDKKLDFKGMEAFVKTSTAASVREKLKQILYDDILNCEYVDQIKVIKDIALLEKGIHDSIENGEKKFYKPVKIRSIGGYDNPMRIQGIKAAYAYNQLHRDGTEAFDLSQRNSIDIVKVFMHPSNIDRIEKTFPDVYQKAIDLMATKEYKGKIDAIAIPLNEPVPGWVLPFVRYDEIINDSVNKFPLESIGLYRGSDNNNYTNIVNI